MALLIDTNCFINLERRKLPLIALAATIPKAEILISSVTASELLVGVHMANTPARKARRRVTVEAILDTIPVLSFNTPSARIHAHIWALLKSEGTTIGAHDLLIAATALAHGLEVVTDNVRDFERIPALSIIAPDWSQT